MIRFIIETTSSKRDVYGNRYHFADITSTITGQRLRCGVGGASNALSLVRQTGARFDEIHNVEIAHVPLRDWRRADKRTKIFEHQVTPDMITALEISERNKSKPA